MVTEAECLLSEISRFVLDCARFIFLLIHDFICSDMRFDSPCTAVGVRLIPLLESTHAVPDQ